jgi:hypothetical protein
MPILAPAQLRILSNFFSKHDLTDDFAEAWHGTPKKARFARSLKNSAKSRKLYVQ